jgi:hypothetical protein
MAKGNFPSKHRSGFHQPSHVRGDFEKGPQASDTMIYMSAPANWSGCITKPISPEQNIEFLAADNQLTQLATATGGSIFLPDSKPNTLPSMNPSVINCGINTTWHSSRRIRRGTGSSISSKLKWRIWMSIRTESSMG